MTSKQLQEIKSKVLLDWAARQLERTKKKEVQNERSLNYARQERAIRDGTYDGPAPRRLNMMRF